MNSRETLKVHVADVNVTALAVNTWRDSCPKVCQGENGCMEGHDHKALQNKAAKRRNTCKAVKM